MTTVNVIGQPVQVSLGSRNTVIGGSALTTVGRAVIVSGLKSVTQDTKLGIAAGVVTGAVSIQADGTAGLVLKNSSGTTVVTVGAGPGTGTTFAGDITGGGEIATSGRVREAGTFAEIHVHSGSTAQTIATGATYAKITLFTDNGVSSNCTPDVANDKITITKTGLYRVEGSFSFSSGTANVNVYGSAFLGGTEQDNIHFERKMGAAGDLGNAGFTGVIDVTSANTDLDFRVRHDNGGNVDITMTYMNLNCTYLGET